jgi:hypothetical protein
VVGDSINHRKVFKCCDRACLLVKKVTNTIFGDSAGDVFIMTKPEIDPSNVLPISLEDLDEEQCREIEQHLKATQEAFLIGCFIKTHQGVVRKPVLHLHRVRVFSLESGVQSFLVLGLSTRK